MSSQKIIHIPFSYDDIKNLNAGDEVLLSGVVYTARDAAHKRMFTSRKLPVDLRNQVIYYTGPTPARPGHVIGSCGPTTSTRMDPFTPFLLEQGLTGVIGKGRRSEEVQKAFVKHHAIYFIAPGGCGALLASSVKKMELVAYPELLSEAIYKLTIEKFPVIVGIDVRGKNVYQS